MLVDGIVTTKETVKVEILPRNAWIELSKLLLEKFKIPHYYDTFEYKINQKGQIIRFIPEYGHQIDWKESVIMEKPTAEQLSLINDINKYNKLFGKL